MVQMSHPGDKYTIQEGSCHFQVRGKSRKNAFFRSLPVRKRSLYGNSETLKDYQFGKTGKKIRSMWSIF